MESASEPTHTLRVWHDKDTRKWRVCRWDEVGGIAAGLVLESGNPRLRTVGGVMVFEGAQISAGQVLNLEHQNATVDRITIGHGNHTYRIWHDDVAAVWVAQQEGAGGKAMAQKLAHERVESDGRFLRFLEAECKIGTDIWLQNANRDAPVVRVMPRSQFVAVPVMGKISAENPPPR